MTILRPQLRGLVSKLALFYVLLSVPTLIVVESTILIFEFGQFMRGIADGSLDRAAEHGAGDLATQWPHLRGSDDIDRVALHTWLDGWVLRLQQPRGGLTPDESYVLMELADAPLAAAVLTPDGRELARSTDDGRWKPAVPTAAEAASAAASANGSAIRLTGADNPQRIRRVVAPVRGAAGEVLGVLFVELRLPPPWRHLLVDSSFESPTVFAFLVVFGIASSIFLAWWVTRRLNRVARAATAWSRGDFSDRINDGSRDELGGLSALLDRMALDLRGLMRSRAQLATLAERQRLARDLHDTVKQKAFALNLQLATARRVIGETPGSERLEQAQRLTQQIQQELAQILDELRASDTELPFIERLRARAIDWSHTSGLAPVFAMDDLPPLTNAQEESLLRIVDEALANVLRHAGATRIEIALRREADRVRLTIVDNGRGIAADHISGMGLDNMRERAQALPGGRFELDAPAGQGTRVTVSFVVADRAV
ncbi:MAG TPA: sensor histidine kinase [Rhodanobacteraceae bacterium]|jgi:signal transduction histidine kinase|nr:sensor histidine kinase [Rhodanobacteraceae bacterium]